MKLDDFLAIANTDTLSVRVPVSNNLIAQIGARTGCSSEIDELSALYGEREVKRVDTDPRNSSRLILELK